MATLSGRVMRPQITKVMTGSASGAGLRAAGFGLQASGRDFAAIRSGRGRDALRMKFQIAGQAEKK
jgi:hypothetical protein